jgi:predicted RND superfamily exporter protein
MTSPLDSFARLVTQHPKAVLAAVLVATVLASVGIGSLRADFTPSDLFAKFEDQEAVSAAFQADFGNTDNLLLMLVESENVLDLTTLQVVHDHARWLDAQPFSARVNALTLLPLPQQVGGEDAAAAERSALAAIYVGLASPARSLEASLRALATGEPYVAPEPLAIPDALLALAAGERTVGPAVAGDTVTAQEAEALATRIRGSGLIEGRLLSHDRTLTAIVVSLEPEFTRNDAIADMVDAVREHLAEVAPPEGVRITLSGLPYVRNDVVQKMRADQSIMLPLSLLVCLILLAVAFRWVPAMTLPIGAVLVSALVLVGGMGWVGEPFNIINNIVPLLIIIIGISNSIHLVNRYGEELRAGHDGVAAAARSVRAMTVACFLTSFTTAVGFASLLVSQTDTLRRFGLTAAVGVLISYVVTITFLPAALSLVRAPKAGTGAAREGALEALIERVTRWIVRHPWPVIVAGTIAFGATFAVGTHVQIDAALLDQFDETDPIYTTTRLVESKLSGVRPIEIYVRSDEAGRLHAPEVVNALDALGAWAAAQDGALSSMSAATFYHEIAAFQRGPEARTEPFEDAGELERARALLHAGDTRPLDAWVTEDGTRARVSVGVVDMGARATIGLADAIEAEARAQLEPLGLEVHLTGDAYVASKGLDAVISDLVGSLGLAVVVIFAFMMLLFRSLRFAVVSVPPNVLPLVTTAAFMVAVGVKLNAATAIIFSISIGMAVDGAIHVLARFREEQSRTPDVDAALIASARGTGKAILMTCVSLMLGFGVMFASSFVPVRLFGALIAVTIAGTLVSTAVVLPALLKVTSGRAG